MRNQANPAVSLLVITGFGWLHPAGHALSPSGSSRSLGRSHGYGILKMLLMVALEWRNSGTQYLTLAKIKFCNVLHLGVTTILICDILDLGKKKINISWILCKLAKTFIFGGFGDTLWLTGRVLRYGRVLYSISITGLTGSQWGTWVGAIKMCFKHFNISDQSENWTLPAHCWVNAHPFEPPWKIDFEREFPYKLNMRVLSCCILSNVAHRCSLK